MTGGNGVDQTKSKAALEQALFADPFLKAYAIIDGARCLELLDRFDDMAPPRECLYLGELEPEVAVVAPYLVELRDDDRFFDWLFDNGWGNSWNVWLTSESEMLDLRAHFRRLTIVEMPDGQFCYFRFYDPRVLRDFLPTCDDGQIGQMFGKVVDRFLVESDGGEDILPFRPNGLD